MPTSFAIGTAPVFIGALEQYLTNSVGDTIYYATYPTVSAATKDGFLDPGQTFRLTGTPTWIVSAGSATIMTAVIEHAQDTTDVHGIADTSLLGTSSEDPGDPIDLTNLPTTDEKAALAGTGTPSVSNPYVTTTDSRMTNSRAPSGAAGGALTGTFPNPTFAVDQASQAELDAAYNTLDGAKINKTLMTTTGDILYATGANTPNRRGIGSSGQVLTVTGGVPTWATPAAAGTYKGTWNATTNTPTLANGTGTAGDNYSVATAGTTDFGAGGIAFAVGDLVSYSGTIWQKVPIGGTGVTSITTATQSGVAGSVTINSPADVALGNVSNLAQVTQALANAKGDLIAATANDTFTRLGVGTNGFTLQADSTAATGLKWAAGQAGNTILDIRDFGASTSETAANNVTFIQATADAAGDGCFIIPAGTFSINAPIVIPSRCTVFLFGKLKAVDTGGAFATNAAAITACHGGAAMVVFCTVAGRNTNGLLLGGGSLLCNRVADYGIQLDSSHGFRASNIEINDAREASIHVFSNEGDVSSSDCDDWVFDQMTHRTIGSSADFKATTLNGAVTTTTQTAWTATTGSNLPASPFFLRCQSEVVYVTTRTGNALTVKRGVWGTTAATHADTTAITEEARPKRFAHVEAGSAGGVADGTFRDSYVEGMQGADMSAVATQGVLSGVGAGTFTVTDGAGFTESTPFFIAIDNEILRVTTKATNTLTVARGVWNTTAASHTVGTSVFSVIKGGWGFWLEDCSRVTVHGKVVSDNARTYCGGVHMRKTNAVNHSMEGNEVLSLYHEAQTGGPSCGVMIFAPFNAPATYFQRWHKVDKLRFDSDAGTKARRIIIANETGTSGYVAGCTYRDPRNSVSAASQIIIGPNCTGNIIEVLGTTFGEGAAVVGQSGNNVHGLMSGGTNSPGAYAASGNY